MNDNNLREQSDGSFKCIVCGKENLRGIIQCAEHWDSHQDILDFRIPINHNDLVKTLKAWEAAKPKLIPKAGKPIIFGTAGANESGIDFNKLWNKLK